MLHGSSVALVTGVERWCLGKGGLWAVVGVCKLEACCRGLVLKQHG